jgi:HEPN domain-containing protein
MKPETLEWIAKAEGGLGTASREVAVVDTPNFDAVCFHSQQCGEKYLKALLVEQGLAVPRVHDLEVLVNLLLPGLPLQQEVMSSARILTSMAVEVRYPGLQVMKMMPLNLWRQQRPYAQQHERFSGCENMPKLLA